MEIKIGNIVKTYDLCTGEIAIGEIEHILDKDVEIEVWAGTDILVYKDEEEKTQILNNTIIWDKDNKRYVFKHWCDDDMACFSTVVLDACTPDVAIHRMVISDEKITNKLY